MKGDEIESEKVAGSLLYIPGDGKERIMFKAPPERKSAFGECNLISIGIYTVLESNCLFVFLVSSVIHMNFVIEIAPNFMYILNF